MKIFSLKLQILTTIRKIKYHSSYLKTITCIIQQKKTTNKKAATQKEHYSSISEVQLCVCTWPDMDDRR